ncbi:group II intron maturase-specific domain-containing protein [Paraburkholderia tuberum]|uniref:group II intron maturase-specific domain-containing protein n=2 Tax=Paraburkholderia TaxID=1822464 RepID=UPI0013A6B387
MADRTIFDTGVSKEVYNTVDTAIWQALWKWFCGRHPCKGARRIRARYFHREGTRRYWVLAAILVN